MVLPASAVSSAKTRSLGACCSIRSVIRLRKRRLHLACNLLEKPPQRFLALTFCATVDDGEGQKKVPVANPGDQRREARLIKLPLAPQLLPEGEGLVVKLNHRVQVGIVAEFS